MIVDVFVSRPYTTPSQQYIGSQSSQSLWPCSRKTTLFRKASWLAREFLAQCSNGGRRRCISSMTCWLSKQDNATQDAIRNRGGTRRRHFEQLIRCDGARGKHASHCPVLPQGKSSETRIMAGRGSAGSRRRRKSAQLRRRHGLTANTLDTAS